MKKIFSTLLLVLLLPLLAYSNKVIGIIGKKGVVCKFNESSVKNFLLNNADYSTVSSITIEERSGKYALHILGFDMANKKTLIVKELKKENNKLIITQKNDNTYLLTRHFCSGMKNDDNDYKLVGVDHIKCECSDPYSDKMYNHTVTTQVGFEYLEFYNAF